MEKDIMTMFMQLMKRKYDGVVLKSKHELPGIIERYKKHGSKDTGKELTIIENYYRQILIAEKAFSALISMFENSQKTK